MSRRLLGPLRRVLSGAGVVGSLDTPAERDLWPAPTTRFTGWALDGGGLPRAVEIILNRKKRFPVVIALPRPDVAVTLQQPGLPAQCGWSADIDLSAWPRGELLVQVVVKRRLGRRVTVATRVYDVLDDSFVGNLDAPGEGEEIADNLLVVSGWAVFEATGPVRVEVEAGGVAAGAARLRLPRPDVEALDPVRMGAFAGFEYSEVLAPELGDEVTVAVRATGMNGRSVLMDKRTVRRLPSATSGGDAHRAAVLRERTAASCPPSLAPASDGRNRPNLLVFTHQLSLGGGQLYLQELLRQLTPDLGSCTLIAPSDGVLHAQLEEFGIDVVVSGRSAPYAIETYEGQVRELSMLIRGTRCDAVLVNTLTELPAADAAQRLGLPVLWAVHESYEIEAWLTVFYGTRKWHPYIADRMRCALAGVSRVIFEAQSTSDLFARHTRPDQRLVIPYGVDLARIDRFAAGFDRVAARSRHDIPADAVVLLVVGQVEERKSQAALVEAFREVAPAHDNATLIMIGDVPGPYSQALRRQMDATGLGDRLRLLPPTSDILEWYVLADVLVSASDVESMPRSMMEAMALGVPVLSAAVHGVPTLITDGVNGWLFAPRDMCALVEGMRKVLDLDQQSRRAAGDAAKSSAAEKFDGSGYARAYLELINQLVLDVRETETEAAHTVGEQPPTRLDQAIAVLDHAARASARLEAAPRPDQDHFSMRLKDFNLDAPHTRDGIAAFVAAAAREVKAGARVVDVGAGDAPYRELFKHVEYVTIDWEHSMHADSAASDISASADQLPLEDGSFDAVLLTEVLEHLSAPERALAEIARVLRPLGSLYLTVPFVWILHELPFDYFRYTPSALLMLLEESGFEDISIVPRGDYFTTIAQLMRIVPSWIDDQSGSDGLADRRRQAGDAMARLSVAFAALSPLDDKALLPLGFNVKARRGKREGRVQQR